MIIKAPIPRKVEVNADVIQRGNLILNISYNPDMSSKLITTALIIISLQLTSVNAERRPVFCRLTINHVKVYMIKESADQYAGNCPCPYNLDRTGNICGERSAYSKSGGYHPLCYDHDITNEMARQHKRQHCNNY